MKRLKLLQKLRCKIQKCKKSNFFLLFRGPVAILFFLQNCIYLRKQSYWTTKSILVEGIQRCDPRNL